MKARAPSASDRGSAFRAEIAAAEAEAAKIDRELDTLLNLILKGGAADAINAKMVPLEQRKKDLTLFLAEAEEPPPPPASLDGAAILQTGPAAL